MGVHGGRLGSRTNNICYKKSGMETFGIKEIQIYYKERGDGRCKEDCHLIKGELDGQCKGDPLQLQAEGMKGVSY